MHCDVDIEHSLPAPPQIDCGIFGKEHEDDATEVSGIDRLQPLFCEQPLLEKDDVDDMCPIFH